MPNRVGEAKSLVWDLWAPVRSPGSLGAIDRSRLSPDLDFHGPAPVGHQSGRDAFTSVWLDRIAAAFPEVERDAYLFLGGEFEGKTWVAETGEWRGVMSGDLLGVPATGRAERLRYGAFHRVEDGRVLEMRVLIDLLALAASAGFDLLPPVPARNELPPGPVLDNGLSLAPQDPEASAETLRLVEDMLGGCNRLVDGELRSMGMDAYWHDDMCWWGPWGVGGTVGFTEFQEWAQGPSVASFPNRRGGFHQARFADGLTACFTGWPSLQGTFDGVAFRGIEPTGAPIGQNIMDFYVRRGELLHENWVLIDLVDFAAQCGVDLLAPLPGAR
ncbi:MAG: ester cyclase [Actinomycetota bacterium]